VYQGALSRKACDKCEVEWAHHPANAHSEMLLLWTNIAVEQLRGPISREVMDIPMARIS
jgi:hypothetical protein